MHYEISMPRKVQVLVTALESLKDLHNTAEKRLRNVVSTVPKVVKNSKWKRVDVLPFL
jgi:hypothetical protein